MNRKNCKAREVPVNRKSLVLVALLGALAVREARAVFEITPPVQKEIDRQVEQIRGWAADPVIVKALFWENQKGPIAGMDNEKWKSVRRSDDLIRSFINSDAGKLLAKKLEASGGLYLRAYLCAEKGENFVSTEKVSRYLNAGQPAFDLPFSTALPWQGPPEFDALTETNDLHVSVPVLHNGKPIGVLTVGLDLGRIAKTVGK